MRNLSQVSSSGRSNLCAVSQRAENACACSCCRRSHACLICAATTCKVASTHYPVHVCLNSQTIRVDNVFSSGKQKREKKCKRYQLNASTRCHDTSPNPISQNDSSQKDYSQNDSSQSDNFTESYFTETQFPEAQVTECSNSPTAQFTERLKKVTSLTLSLIHQ